MKPYHSLVVFIIFVLLAQWAGEQGVLSFDYRGYFHSQIQKSPDP